MGATTLAGSRQILMAPRALYIDVGQAPLA